MASGRTTALTIRLSPAQRQLLLARQRATNIPAGSVRRARIIILLADRMTITAIAAKVGMSRRHVYKWVQRFVEQGMEGLADKPRCGRRSTPRPGAPTDAHGRGQEYISF
jgi:CRP-like cAMP-binding protein